MRKQDLIEITIATILSSLIGVVVKYIDATPGFISWGRAFSTAIAMMFFLILFDRKSFLVPSRKDFLMICLQGVLMCGNWYFYIIAIKISTVAIAVVSMFTFPLITAFIEPFAFKEKMKYTDVLAALFAIIGVFFIVPKFSLADRITLGVVFGVLSAFSFSFRSILSRKVAKKYNANTILIYQYLIATLIFFQFFIFEYEPLTIQSYVYLLSLGMILTTFPQLIFIRAFRRSTAARVSIFMSLQPVYAVLLAYIILHEIPSSRTILGGVIITSSVFLSTVIKYDGVYEFT